MSEITRLNKIDYERMKNIVNALDDHSIVAITDKAGNIIYANKKLCEISKYSREELIGQNHRILKSGLHPTSFFVKMWDTISQGKVWRGNIKNRAKDGTFYWVKTSIYPIIGNDGTPEQYVAIRTDITEQVSLYERLRDSMETITKSMRITNTYENSPDLFRTITTDGITIQCNESYARALGYSKDDIIGQSVYEHTTEESVEMLNKSVEKWKKTGIITNAELMLKRKDGSTFPVLLSANNLYDEDGNLIGSNTILRDISELYNLRKEKEEKDRLVNEQYLQLLKLSHEKDDFLAMITHELKTPLTPIKSYVDILLSAKTGQLSEFQFKAVEAIKTNVDLMSKLISDLLDAQKLELGTFKLHKERHQVSKIISDTIAGLDSIITKKGILLTFDLLDEDVFCFCDEMRIKQVMTNLISNAIDFCPKTDGNIKISLLKENSFSKIIIKDNGIGMEESNLDKLFTKFYQVDTATTREHGGTGLGLVICKGIVESHDGKIYAMSEGVGKGMEIHILLPDMIAN